MREPDWKRLGDYVVRRRTELGYRSQAAFEQASGISYRTLSRVETGLKVSRSTLLTIERVLEWEIGSVDRILAGGDPTPIQMDKPPLTEEQQQLMDVYHFYVRKYGRTEALARIRRDVDEINAARSVNDRAAG